MRMRTLVALIIFPALSSPVAAAQEGFYSKTGLMLNIPTEDSNIESALGFGLSFGYDFNKLSVEGELILSEHQGDPGYADLDFSGISLNVIYPFLSRDDRSRLYVLAGYGLYEYELNNGNTWEGDGYNLGLGSEYYLNEKILQYTRLTYRFIEYDEVNNPAVRVPREGDTISVEIGIKHRF
jgi:hypothetical protein